jgi:hypothetical protein
LQDIRWRGEEEKRHAQLRCLVYGVSPENVKEKLLHFKITEHQIIEIWFLPSIGMLQRPVSISRIVYNL